MKNMFAISFVILFVFIMVLCAIQPICFANALEEYSDYILTVDETDIYYSNCNLMLDKDTPLTLGYLRDNPVYSVYISSTGGNTPIQAIRPNDTACSLGNAQNGPVELNYNTNTYINTYYEKYGDEIWDYPIRVGTTGDHITVYANKPYELSLLEKMALLFSHILNSVQTIINFIMDNPLVILSTCLAFISSVIFIAKRNSRVG